MNSRATLRLLPLAAVASIIGGLIVMLRSEATPATFGWFAYAPLSDDAGALEGVHVISTAGVVGAVILVVGLVVLAFWVGLRWGGRRTPSRTP